ncbi:hypothetical protein [Vulcanisaeta sp. JCM 16159]|uniref:hypothetical protein n=1 Tax=Vulcanisaeta sp. JCM 16159 TaxID=1295371 RepID=UPI0006D198A5|nr:hypothetical protein [Vulcanisaeta sp. JCM 16159]
MVRVGDIELVVRDCLGSIGVSASNCEFGVYDCRSINVHGAGAYIFFDDSGVYYVGEADDVARRLLQEHCRANIGNSEGVVRFLMHYLDEVCANSGEWIRLDAAGREEFVKEILREEISSLRIYVVTCKGLSDEKQGNRRVRNRVRKRLEDCLRGGLRPMLNSIGVS